MPELGNVTAARFAAFLHMTERFGDKDLAMAICMAMHPLDDNFIPTSPDFEAAARTSAMGFSKAIGTISSLEDAYAYAGSALEGYRMSAISHREPYYSTRYDQALAQLGGRGLR